MQPVIQIDGRFNTPSAGWRITVKQIGSPESISHTQRRENAIADLLRAERRESRRGAAHVLFNLPPTHEFFLERLKPRQRQVVVRISVRVLGTATHKHSRAQLTALQQLDKLARFWAALLVNDGRGHPDTWEFVRPGYDAYYWWANALVSQYVAFFGEEKHRDRRDKNPLPRKKPK